MDTTDKDKLDLVGVILPVVAELRRFYELQWECFNEMPELMKTTEDWIGMWKHVSKEADKTSRRVHALGGIAWAIIDEVCESLGVVYYKFTDGIIDEDEENEDDTTGDFREAGCQGVGDDR